MITLRVKLVVPAQDGYEDAHKALSELSEIHADQAIFQTNRTRYVDGDSWGVQITHEAELYTRKEFVQSVSLPEIERAMAAVAPDSFERRIDKAGE